jgi:hypothetical protein
VARKLLIDDKKNDKLNLFRCLMLGKKIPFKRFVEYSRQKLAVSKKRNRTTFMKI